MTTQELFAQGNLPALHQQVAADIRNHPQDAEARALFIQVLCLEGEWQRAATQADALLKLHPASALFCTTISQLITAELKREAVFSGKAQPEWKGDKPAYAEDLCAAMGAYAGGHFAAAAAATARVQDALEPCPVSPDGAPALDWLIDADARLAGVVEYLKDEHYCLIAQGDIQSMEIAAPTHPVELLWPHVRITLRSGEILVGRTTGRYPVCGAAVDPALLMMKEAAWQECAENLYLGSGQHCWSSPEDLIPLLSVSRLHFS